MTKSPEGPRCGWCHRPLDPPAGAGRPKRFCSPSHRQRAYEARRRAAALALPAGQSVVADADLRRLHDRLYRLETAVEDVVADLAERGIRPDYKSAYEHLLEASQDLIGLVLEPVRQ